jgi:hypothetical protein
LYLYLFTFPFGLLKSLKIQQRLILKIQCG